MYPQVVSLQPKRVKAEAFTIDAGQASAKTALNEDVRGEHLGTGCAAKRAKRAETLDRQQPGAK